MQMQMPPLVNDDAGMASARRLHLTGNIILGMPGRHQHSWYHDNAVSPALDAAVEALLDGGLGKFEEATLHNLPRVVLAEQVHQLQKLFGALWILTTMPDNERCWLRHCSALPGSLCTPLASKKPPAAPAPTTPTSRPITRS